MPKIKSSNYTSWSYPKNATKQPKGINYSELLNQLSHSKNNIKDLRGQNLKLSSNENIHNITDKSVEKIDKKSVIPIPGLMIEYENSESDWQPSSEWHTPHGVHWGL